MRHERLQDHQDHQAERKIGIDMITGLVNQIIVGVISAEWELSTIVNRYKGKGDALERKRIKGLKLADQVLRMVERFMEKLIKHQVHFDEMQFGFMPVCGTTKAIFILRQLQKKFLTKKQNLYSAFADLEKVFDRVHREFYGGF